MHVFRTCLDLAIRSSASAALKLQHGRSVLHFATLSADSTAPRGAPERRPTGSRALDALTHGGYPAGAIVELTGPEIEPCSQVAWLAVAAAQRAVAAASPDAASTGATAFAVGGDAFVKGAQGVGADAGSARVMTTTLANPQAILATLKRFRQTRGLVLLESIHKVAEEAAPAGADAAAARALRARKLGRFLLHLAFSLQKEEEEQKQLSAAARGRGAARGRYGEALSRCRGSGGSGDDGAAGQGGAAAPRTSVLVCNMRVGSPNSFDSLLQQYASMRLRLTRAGGDGDRSAAALVPRVHDGAAGGAVPGAAAADVVAARGLARVVTAHMLKGPGVTSRMSAPSCSLYLPPPGQAASVAAGGAGAATSGGTSGAPVLRAGALPHLALPAWQLLDLVEAGRQFGLVHVTAPGRAAPAAPAVEAGAPGGGGVAAGTGTARPTPAGVTEAEAVATPGSATDGTGHGATAAPVAGLEADGALWSYGGCEAPGQLELVERLAGSKLAADLAIEVDALLQRLRKGAE